MIIKNIVLIFVILFCFSCTKELSENKIKEKSLDLQVLEAYK